MSRSRFFFKFLFALLVFGLLAGALALGAGAAFRAGWAQGYTVALSAGSAAPAAPIPAPYFYGHPGFWGPMPGFFFGPLACLFGLFLFFFVFGGIMRLAAGRRHAWHGRGPCSGPHGDPGDHGVPPWMREMHQRLHQEPPAEPGEPAPAA